MFIMIIMSAPLVYIFIFSSAGLQILVLLELASYGLRIIVVSFVGCCPKKDKGRGYMGYQPVY